MAWRDRLRRRTAAPDTTERTGAERSGAAPNGPPDAGPEPGTSGPAGSTVPGDWDGGWRRTAAPQLTVARAPLGVSDGLAFRAGLSSWQNPSFDSGLGHAMLPTAPTGLVRGVTHPATPQAARSGGGPLLLRALRPEGAGEQADGTPAAGPSAAPVRPSRGKDVAEAADTGSGRRPVVAPSGANSSAGKGSSGKAAPRTRGLTATDSPAVLPSSSAPVQRAALPGTDPVVTPAPPHSPPAPAARRPLREFLWYDAYPCSRSPVPALARARWATRPSPPQRPRPAPFPGPYARRGLARSGRRAAGGDPPRRQGHPGGARPDRCAATVRTGAPRRSPASRASRGTGQRRHCSRTACHRRRAEPRAARQRAG